MTQSFTPVLRTDAESKHAPSVKICQTDLELTPPPLPYVDNQKAFCSLSMLQGELPFIKSNTLLSLKIH